MAKTTNIIITAPGLPGTPVGATITYQVGVVPTATVHLAPGKAGAFQVDSGTKDFANIDKLKRKEDITLTLSAISNSVEAGARFRTVKFVGLLDGLSIANAVGQNSYQAVLKNKAQKLLELTTFTPGLTPTSVNIYRTSSHSISNNVQNKESEATKAWGTARLQISDQIMAQNPIKFWIELLRVIVKTQQTNYKTFVGGDKMVTGEAPFEKIFSDERYQKSLKDVAVLLANIDTSAIDGGELDKAKSSGDVISKTLKDMFAGSSQIFLENLMSFLSEFGCTIIFGNSKMFVVPINSVIKQDNEKSAPKQSSRKPNAAVPADYNNYSYNDNGYRELGSVLVTTNRYVGGSFLAGRSYDRGQVAHYVSSPDISAGSGIFVVETSPWMAFAHDSPQATDSKEGAVKSNQVQQSMHPEQKSYADVKQATTEKYEEKTGAKWSKYSNQQYQLLLNYGETLFYQQRYGDRHGSITMEFNPDWVPGTGGSLYIRESDLFINFYVTSVTHQVETSAPGNGQAITSIGFCCGRVGSPPPGAETYLFLGYNRAKEKAVQEAFIKDIS